MNWKKLARILLMIAGILMIGYALIILLLMVGGQQMLPAEQRLPSGVLSEATMYGVGFLAAGAVLCAIGKKIR